MLPITPGARLNHYQILSLLGAGGMGEVYLAQDLRLGRKVALKFLPSRFTKDDERLRRFEQEAQAASALNHPNIITIYEVGKADDVHFIATEFIEGTTLRKRISGARLRTDEVLDVAIQIASALVAAHSAGIVHRDIKPENIMVRPDRYVKILDFGLAKLTERVEVTSQLDPKDTDNIPDVITTEETVEEDLTSLPAQDSYQTSPVLDVPDTTPGIVLGTAQYMSPEHARGLKVDARTDIFSLGIVLYEMIAGRHPFTGATRREIVSAVINLDPIPLSHYRPELPDVLEWIVTKSLSKDREERYQTARELLNDLRRLQHRLRVEREVSRAQSFASQHLSEVEATGGLREDSAKGSRIVERTRPLTARLSGGFKLFLTEGSRFGRVMKIVTVLLIVGLIAAYTYWLRRLPVVPFGAMKVSRFTSTGNSTRAAISSDGKYVVYAEREAGKQSLWVRQVAARSSVEIVLPAEVSYRGMTFSPDGNFIFYVVQEGNNPIDLLYQVPVLGGQPHRLMVDIDSPITFSPEGQQLAFVRRYRGTGEDALMVAQVDGTGERKLATRKGTDFFGIGGPAWSLDGKVIACPAGSNAGGRYMSVVEVRVRDGVEKAVSNHRWSNVGRVAWSRGGGLVISATEFGSTLAQLWHLSYPGGEPRKITNDLNDYRDASLTADSKALVSVQYEAHVNIWLAPQGDATRARQVTSGVGQYNGVRGLTWTPDGRIVYVSRLSGSQDIWIMQSDGTNQRQLTTAETRADVYPSVSSDGRSIVFVSTRTGNSNLYRIDIDGGNLTQLTSGSSEEFPDISPDGKWVVYTATGSTNFRLWRVPITGGNAVQITDKLAQWPAISPDGKWIACWYRNQPHMPWQLAIIPFDGGLPTRVFDVPATAASAIPMRWTPDGRGLSFVDTRSGTSNIWNQPIDGSGARQISGFTSDQIFWFSWSPGGGQLAVSRGSDISDAVLFTEGQ